MSMKQPTETNWRPIVPENSLIPCSFSSGEKNSSKYSKGELTANIIQKRVGTNSQSISVKMSQIAAQ